MSLKFKIHYFGLRFIKNTIFVREILLCGSIMGETDFLKQFTFRTEFHYFTQFLHLQINGDNIPVFALLCHFPLLSKYNIDHLE